MKHQGLEFFALIVVVSIMEAWQGRSWMVIAIWLTIGFFILLMDRPPKHHGHAPRHVAHR